MKAFQLLARMWPLPMALSLTGCGRCGFLGLDCPSEVPDSVCWEHPTTATPTSCSDEEHEPNDTMPMSEEMAGATCGATTSHHGAVGGDDVDYFHADGTLCDPKHLPATLSIESGEVRACLFIQCRTGSTSLDLCPKDATTTHLPNGLIGCCRRGPGDLSATFNCTSVKPNVDVYVAVDQAAESAECRSYEFSYSL